MQLFVILFCIVSKLQLIINIGFEKQSFLGFSS